MAELEDDFFGGFGVCEDSDEDKELKKNDDVIPEEVVSFDRWPELAPELKMVVISYLDFFTKLNLSLCSKSDHDIINSSPIQISNIEIKDDEQEHYQISNILIDNISVRIEFTNERDEKKNIIRQLNFTKRGENDTEIRWRKWTIEGPVIQFIKLEGRNNYEEAVTFVEKWMKRSRYSVKSLTVEMKRWNFETSEIKSLPYCDDIRICNKDESFLKWWLKKVDPNLKILQLHRLDFESSFSTEFLFLDHIKMCDRLYIWGNCKFTDEQFLSLTCSIMYIESDTITEQGVNQFIQNWVNGKTWKRTRYFAISTTRTIQKTDILENITFRLWDGDFENEAHGFCGDWKRAIGRGDCYQIQKGDDSGTSATLDIKSDEITFAVTGTQIEHDGQTFTTYGIPFGV